MWTCGESNLHFLSDQVTRSWQWTASLWWVCHTPRPSPSSSASSRATSSSPSSVALTASPPSRWPVFCNANGCIFMQIPFSLVANRTRLKKLLSVSRYGRTKSILEEWCPPRFVFRLHLICHLHVTYLLPSFHANINKCTLYPLFFTTNLML